MKKLLAILLIAALVLGTAAPVAAEGESTKSEPISHGTINKVTWLHWGKSELYPTLAMVGTGQEFDVFEYDKDWVMVRYDTWVSQGVSSASHSFYCYVKREDITCDPELKGDESKKADTGPGKRKGKKFKSKPAEEKAETTEPQVPEKTEESKNPEKNDRKETDVEVVSDEEYDWIIRTPGICNVTLYLPEGTATVSFALMAQKAGGTAPSSDPAFNHGMRTPYAAMCSYKVVVPMSGVLDNMGVSGFLEGSGGAEVSGQTAGSRFYLDTGAMDPALVSFPIHMDGKYILNPKIVGYNVKGELSASENRAIDLQVQLKKGGKGYQFVLVGMRPGGGDLTFPALLEKVFADTERWDREAQDADRSRKEAEQVLKEIEKKAAAQVREKLEERQQGGTGEESRDTQPLAPLVPEDPLAPLVEEDPLAPLVPEEPLASLVEEDPLAPLVPTPDEEVSYFPSRT